MFKKKNSFVEQRKYVRIPTVIPVQFSVVNKNKELAWNTSYQGFTRDLNEGGICLEINNLDDNLITRLTSDEYLLLVHIDLPTKDRPIDAYAQPRWVKKLKDTFPNKCMIGVSFDTVTEEDRTAIIKYARRVRRRPKQIAALVFVLAALAASSMLQDFKLQYDNKQLTHKLSLVLEEKRNVDMELQKIEDKRIMLEDGLKAANFQIQNLTNQLSQVADAQVGVITVQLEKIRKNKEQLTKALTDIGTKEQDLNVRKQELLDSKQTLEQKNTERMYTWMLLNQNSQTGLVPSFEGDADMLNFSFTYDQSLVIMNCVANGDLAIARKNIDFFMYKARRYQGGLLNAYETGTGRVVEWAAHVGPNAWIGMAVLWYVDRTGSDVYLEFAKKIGDWILNYQDQEGGIRGGPTVTWYATEHNVDCFAFFRMLYHLTNDRKYLDASNRIMEWMKAEAYNKLQKRFNRGKNDPFVATDATSFTIPALGPKRLLKEGINPEDMIRFTESTSRVITKFVNNEGKEFVITGFDYTDPKLVGRRPIVSSEWTAQMVTAYNCMADFYQSRDAAKSKQYAERAAYYLTQLDAMMIMSPYSKTSGGGGLPYATGAGADTGHGWITPKSPFAISIAGTAYTLFARKKINPFCLPSEKKDYL